MFPDRTGSRGGATHRWNPAKEVEARPASRLPPRRPRVPGSAPSISRHRVAAEDAVQRPSRRAEGPVKQRTLDVTGAGRHARNQKQWSDTVGDADPRIDAVDHRHSLGQLAIVLQLIVAVEDGRERPADVAEAVTMTRRNPALSHMMRWGMLSRTASRGYDELAAPVPRAIRPWSTGFHLLHRESWSFRPSESPCHHLFPMIRGGQDFSPPFTFTPMSSVPSREASSLPCDNEGAPERCPV